MIFDFPLFLIFGNLSMFDVALLEVKEIINSLSVIINCESDCNASDLPNSDVLWQNF